MRPNDSDRCAGGEREESCLSTCRNIILQQDSGLLRRFERECAVRGRVDRLRPIRSERCGALLKTKGAKENKKEEQTKR